MRVDLYQNENYRTSESTTDIAMMYSRGKYYVLDHVDRLFETIQCQGSIASNVMVCSHPYQQSIEDILDSSQRHLAGLKQTHEKSDKVCEDTVDAIFDCSTFSLTVGHTPHKELDTTSMAMQLRRICRTNPGHIKEIIMNG